MRRKIRSASHGAVWALWRIIEELELLNIFHQHFSLQLRDGLPVGKSLLLAAVHRAVKPGSKRSFASWARQTTLPEIAGFDPDRLDSQHFWEQMATVTEEQLEGAERAIARQLLAKGLLSPRLLFYDLTNFFTHIASGNERSELAQRGRNKQKRHDLRQFGLAQVVTREFLIPVLSEVYAGHRPDTEMFGPMLTRVRHELVQLELEVQELTLVFDKGSNSRKNFARLDAAEIPYVASLTPAHHEDLLAVPLSRQVRVGEKDVWCYRTRKKIWGKERTIVIYRSEKLYRGQMRGLKQALTRKYHLLEEYRRKLNAPRAKKKRREEVERQVQEILQGERCERLIRVTITEKAPGRFDIDWQIDPEVYRWVTENLYGKRLLVTCREEWSEQEIIAAYQGQSNVERVFRHLKNPCHNAIHPQYHWTDQKIRVHAFICLIGLLLSQVLGKKAREAGHNLSLENLIDKLTEVRQAEIVTLSSLRGKPVKETQTEEMPPQLQKLYADLVK